MRPGKPDTSAEGSLGKDTAVQPAYPASQVTALPVAAATPHASGLWLSERSVVLY